MKSITKAEAIARLTRKLAVDAARQRRWRAKKARAKALSAQKDAASIARLERKKAQLLEKRKKAARAKKRLEQRALRIQADKDRREKLSAFIASETN